MKNKNVSKEAVPFGKRVLGFVQNNSVPLMFVLILSLIHISEPTRPY